MGAGGREECRIGAGRGGQPGGEQAGGGVAQAVGELGGRAGGRPVREQPAQARHRGQITIGQHPAQQGGQGGDVGARRGRIRERGGTGQVETGQQRTAVGGQQHVLGVDPAVRRRRMAGVRPGQRVGQGRGQGERPVGRDRTRAQRGGQRDALDQVGGEPGAAGRGDPAGPDRDDAGVAAEPGGGRVPVGEVRLLLPAGHVAVEQREHHPLLGVLLPGVVGDGLGAGADPAQPGVAGRGVEAGSTRAIHLNRPPLVSACRNAPEETRKGPVRQTAVRPLQDRRKVRCRAAP
ncbi:hypothetical protein GCM10010168_86460 [Actinoplanes ianthinogenes]|uniref:Uncharacterized protein n=1 Tax=Actinoplanes ianthinogenes TaxID=122358 RepID=A0ABM7M186_9ACTN|nr:hypothetical protein [Actinoplanes ianthinogenes]BCJ45377.1 hypothetical protein Aiant_60340 [Actinoplanes ianthinogenes]GGR54094.1 hypothetical protein GCM10010168_86460 [Actinoplanes ianthinogenes]